MSKKDKRIPYSGLEDDENTIKTTLPYVLEIYENRKGELNPEGKPRKLMVEGKKPSKFFLQILKKNFPKQYKEMSEAGFVDKI